MTEAASVREELERLAQGLRAHAEWQMETGVTGLPRATRPAASLATSPTSPIESEIGPSALPAGPSALPAVPSAAFLGSPFAPDAAVSVPASGAVKSALSREDAKVRLVQLAEEIRGCQKCPLSRTRTQTVFARGNPAAELCFIGEGPGADEDAQGFPFVGKAGQLLDRMIAAMGFARDDVYVCNIVKCRPPDNRKPEPSEMASCTPYLKEQLELVSPKVIVALGATAVEGLIGMSGGITRIRGQWKLYRKIPVMPTFHPAYLLRTPAVKREVWADLQEVLKQLGRSAKPSGRST